MTDAATLTATELGAHYARGTLSPREVARACLDRIARHEPALNAMAVIDTEGAMAAAADSERRWRAGRPLSPLDGVPATVKDLLHLAGHPTRRGSRATDTRPMTEDSPVVLGLKAAGTVILGKTTTTEFGWKSPGDCPLHGITRNPWNLAMTPGGSSCGAGTAAAAGYGPLHIGTDAGGSIRIPASWCGIVGVKPSFGRVPQWPLGAFAQVAVAGPMTRTVADAALMLDAIGRFDWRDPLCLPSPTPGWLDRVSGGVRGLTVAIVRRFGFAPPADAASLEAVDRAAKSLADAGAIVTEADPSLPDTRALFAAVWGQALKRLVDGFDEERRALLDAPLVAMAQRTAPMDAESFLAVQAASIETAHAMAAFHRRHDIVLCPAAPQAALPAEAALTNPEEELWQRWAPWTFAFNLSRQPAVAVPVSIDADGLPRGVQVAAALYRDDLALAAAAVIEAACAAPTLAPLG
ncbi:amidase family protein [Elioraea sp.]|uniref:amidase family protein n=1 Tax=Elioraea sp. TaxID=2185103 RepID=UPI0025C1ADE8|nr:amidase family protein [Elioraea sp.]